MMNSTGGGFGRNDAKFNAIDLNRSKFNQTTTGFGNF
jgi:hypothetical protein